MWYLSQLDERTEKRRWDDFKLNMTAANLHLVNEIMKLDFDSKDDGLADPLSEEEIEDYVPLTAVELSAVIDDLAGFGLRMG